MISRMFPQIAMAVASDAIEAVYMPPIALAAVSDTIRPVAVKIRIRQVWVSMLKTMTGFRKFQDASFVGLDQTFRQGPIHERRLDRAPPLRDF